MTTEQLIHQKLSTGMDCSFLDISNESHMHNVPKDSESHFRVVIVSAQFSGKALLARHRSVNKLLADELAGSVHALALHTFTPDEWTERGETATPSPACKGGSSA